MSSVLEPDIEGFLRIDDEDFFRVVRAAFRAGFTNRIIPGRLMLRYLDFESGITDTLSPNYNTHTVIGRHAPYLEYVGTTERVLRFSAEFISETENFTALDAARWLQALVLPWRSRQTPLADDELDNANPPPLMSLQIYPRTPFLNVQGVVTKVEIVKTLPLLPETLIRGQKVLGRVSATVEFRSTEDLTSFDAVRHAYSADLPFVTGAS